MTLHVYEDLEQRSPEWHAARRGIVTASMVDKLITIGSPDALTVACPTCSAAADGPCLSMAAKRAPTPIKTIHDARTLAAANLPPVYRPADNDTSRAITATLVGERIAGFTEESSFTRDMERGVLMEPFAREEYAKHHAPVVEVGFMRLEESWGTLGYSPDGLVGDDGLIEIKAPRTKGHLLAILAGEVPAHNIAQCQAGLLVSGRSWLDFVSYVGGMPLFVKRVTPDPAWHEAIVAACIAFETNAAAIVAAYTTATTGLPVTERVDPNVLELRLA